MKNLLDDLRAECRGAGSVTVSLIVEEAARAFEKTDEEIWNRDRRKRSTAEVALIRAVVWAVARDLMALTYQELGRMFGRHHSTVHKQEDIARQRVPDVVRRFRAQVQRLAVAKEGGEG